MQILNVVRENMFFCRQLEFAGHTEILGGFRLLWRWRVTGGVLNVLNGLTSVQWCPLDSKRVGPQEGLACVWILRRWTK